MITMKADPLILAERLAGERQDLRERQATPETLEANRLALAEAHRQVGVAAIADALRKEAA